METLMIENVALKQKLSKVESKVNNLERFNRSYNIEIQDIPEKPKFSRDCQESCYYAELRTWQCLGRQYLQVPKSSGEQGQKDRYQISVQAGPGSIPVSLCSNKFAKMQNQKH